MRVVLFGATGMVGSGTLIECLDHPDVEGVLSVGRRPSGRSHEKLEDLIHADFTDFSGAIDALRGYDAALYCIGVTSAGMSEEAYREVTVDMTVAAAGAMLEANPESRICFVSGAGTDASERGRVMWARVKGEAENRVAAMPFASVHLFRPGYIQPLKGVRSATRMYDVAYRVVGPAYPLLARLFPRRVTTTEKLGLALIRAARVGDGPRVVESWDVNGLAEAEQAYLAPGDR